MLSKQKLTLSLASLVMLFAITLVVVPSAIAADEALLVDDAAGSFSVTISVDEAVEDVSSDDGIQVASSRDRADRTIEDLDEDAVAAGAGRVVLLISFEKIVQLQILDPETLAAAVDAAETADGDKVDTSDLVSGDDFGADDIIVDAYDIEGRALGSVTLLEAIIEITRQGEAAADEAVTIIKHKNPGGRIPGELPGREFVVQLDQQELENVYQEGRGGGFRPEGGLEIHTLLFSIGANKVVSADRAEVAAFRADTHKHLHKNKVSNVLQVDLVDDDEGDANYSRIVGTTATPVGDSGIPGVVAITTDNQIVRGAFYVRVLLTEQPHKNTFSLSIDGGADKGTAGAPEWLYAIEAAELDTEPEDTAPTVIGGSYADGNLWTPSGLDDASVTGTYLTGAYTIVEPETSESIITAKGGSVPQPTGRDNMYHMYRVMVVPAAGYNGPITVSVAQFDDKVLSLPNTYLPLSLQQRRAITLPDAAKIQRDARIRDTREVITVTSRGIAAAADIYKANNDIFAANPNSKPLGAKLVIPAGGFLVLTQGAVADSGVQNVSAKIVDRKTTVQEAYNVSEKLELPFPASDLDNFFRNGGSLSLIYLDIPAATGSGHDDAKAQDKLKDGKTHPDYTGYDGATTNPYTVRALIINEIMWGLDAGETTSQYIELHNPGTTAIALDSKEWAIAVGSAPAGFTVIDTVNNNPATGYWPPPGNSGVTVATASTPTILDLVSMSRVTGGTDGTAAASWAASKVPSSNLSGRRVGSPGATNSYVMPAAPDTTTTETTTPAAPPAAADDITISEIMVASNDGRLPQWIELSNDSTAAVSLTGWSLEIENDSADADVVGESIELDLGDVEIGVGEVALVVSKEGRNSGVDTAGAARVKGDANAGDLDADRIINVQSDVSPANARYSLISEMGFMISLIPPQTGAVRTPGDVVGNLGGGWELPMSEDGRSSLIRSDKDADDGTDAADWMLASDTMLNGAYRATYYGSDEDVGTPGYDAGGALPVELSGFNAARDKVTGAVVITWATQSELNNAGFFIKRSQQQKGTFVVVNPTMIAGAGTTAEKQSYTYTDATADPNVIYYYQIEDVSLDGNRQTLTRAHRLKGHIGAAGKATTTWGELKSSRE